jgi:hypothetical protein
MDSQEADSGRSAGGDLRRFGGISQPEVCCIQVDMRDLGPLDEPNVEVVLTGN